MKLTLQDIYETATDKTDAIILLDMWYRCAAKRRTEAIKRFYHMK
ncbi:MAG TPA: hypothetical protein VF941_08930 [Clostridia bacterium]